MYPESNLSCLFVEWVYFYFIDVTQNVSSVSAVYNVSKNKDGLERKVGIHSL